MCLKFDRFEVNRCLQLWSSGDEFSAEEAEEFTSGDEDAEFSAEEKAEFSGVNGDDEFSSGW